MRHHRNCIDPLHSSPAQTITMSQVADVMSMGDENLWLIPIMSSILQEQGTNIRAMCYHILQCREGAEVEPRLNDVTVQKVIETVINDNWLQLASEAELEDVKKSVFTPAPQKLKTILASKTRTERDIFLWNCTGLLIQLGEGRNFRSYEETWTVLASFWGMKAPVVVPTCTTLSTFHDEDIPIGQGFHLHYHRYFDHARRTGLIVTSDPDEETTDPATPLPPRRPHVNLEILASMADCTWNPDLHQGLDYLWTIMNESERKSFLEGITTERTSTSMSTVVPMPPKAVPLVTRPLQPQPPQEGQELASESTIVDGQPGGAGETPASSSQPAQIAAAESHHDTAVGVNVTQQDTVAVAEESDRGSATEAATIQSSEMATAGSSRVGVEQSADAAAPPHHRNHLRNYTLGSLHLDSYVDIFNILSASASRYVDPQGTHVRKLTMANYPYQIRAALGDQDPVIVLVDAEIEQAIFSKAGDLTKVREVYQSEHGIDWIKFQYHLSLMQHVAPMGWNAPGSGWVVGFPWPFKICVRGR